MVGATCAALAAPAGALAQPSSPTTGATTLFRTDLPPLAVLGGASLSAGAYGSSLYPKPGTSDEFYGLTDRGPNVDSPVAGQKIEPLPSYQPQIGLFRLVDGTATLLQVIGLQGPDGSPYNGQVNPEASTKETIVDLDGNRLADSPLGYDSEGLVAMPDGTFYVSDEYGPYITHFDATGRQLDRLSPFDGSLPRELAMRDPNKGMEGLTVTPDGTTLVGVMQSALITPDLSAKPKNVVPLRIVTIDLATKATHEYLYLRHLDSAETNVSEITALGNTTFLVDERDGSTGPDTFKKLYKIDLAGATDVGPASTVAGATYDPAAGGLLVQGRSIEATVGKATEAAAATTLTAAGITPVTSREFLDVTALVHDVDPTGGYFAHDKIEGVAVQNGTGLVTLSNDSDYGIDAVAEGSTSAPYSLHVKTTPDGKQDDGAFLQVDMTKVAAAFAPGYTAPTLTSAVTGSTLTVSATGLEPATTYALRLRTESAALGTLTTDARGTASAAVAVPADFGGAQVVQAALPHGVAANTTVTLPAVSRPGHLQVLPGTAEAGGVLGVLLTGWAPDTTLTLQVEGSSRTQTVRTNAFGFAVGATVLDAATPAGTHTLRVTAADGATRTGELTVTPLVPWSPYQVLSTVLRVLLGL